MFDSCYSRDSSWRGRQRFDRVNHRVSVLRFLNVTKIVRSLG